LIFHDFFRNCGVNYYWLSIGGGLLTTGCGGAGGSVVQPEQTRINRPGSRIKRFFKIIAPATAAYGYHGLHR